MAQKSLETVDLKAVEIFAAGQWNGDKYEVADLQAMVDAYGKVGFQPTVKAGHADGQEDEKAARKVFGAPSLGYADRIYVQGQKLLADLTAVPRRFAELIKTKAFNRVSSEIYWQYKDDTTGKTYPRVLKSVAFLGADIPALTSLDAIEALYSKGEGGRLFAYDEHKNEFRLYEKDYCGCGGVVESGGSAGLSEFLLRQPRKTKEAAGYRQADDGVQEACFNCKFFVSWLNACTLVEGFIEGNYVSSYFEPRPGFEVKKSVPNAFDKKDYTVEKRDGKFCLIASDGKVLGCHATEAEAMAQERAVQASKNSSRNQSAQVYSHKTKAKEYAMTVKEENGEYCVFDGDEKVKCYPSKDEAEAHLAKLSKKEEDYTTSLETEKKKLEEDFKAKEAALTAKFNKQLEDAKAEAKAEAKKSQELDTRIQKLESERKAERVDAWIKEQKQAGHLLPVQEGRIRAILYSLPEGGEKTLKYSHDGKDITESPADALKAYVESQPSLFKTLSNQGQEVHDDGTPLDNPGDEVDRRTKLYMKENKLEDKDYGKAVRQVLRADPELAKAWNEGRQ